MFKLDIVPRCPSGVDELLSDETVSTAPRALVNLVHPALADSVLLVVVVRNDTAIGSTAGRSNKWINKREGEGFLKEQRWKPAVSPAVVVVDHSEHGDAVTHVHGQNHGEEPSAEERSCFPPVGLLIKVIRNPFFKKKKNQIVTFSTFLTNK